MQTETRIMYATKLQNEVANSKAQEEELHTKLKTEVTSTLRTKLRNDVREELSTDMKQCIERHIREMQGKVDTGCETASVLVNNSAELSRMIYNEVERAISKTWDNMGQWRITEPH